MYRIGSIAKDYYAFTSRHFKRFSSFLTQTYSCVNSLKFICVHRMSIFKKVFTTRFMCCFSHQQTLDFMLARLYVTQNNEVDFRYILFYFLLVLDTEFELLSGKYYIFYLYFFLSVIISKEPFFVVRK